jgi:hypothetical protein
MTAMAKVSVTIDRDKLRMLRRRAKRLHGGNLSAVIDEATEHLRRLEAMDDFLDHVGAPQLTPQEVGRIEAEWRGEAGLGRRRRRPA